MAGGGARGSGARITRRRFIECAAAGVALLGLGGCGWDARRALPSSEAVASWREGVRAFRSRPYLAPPEVSVNTPARGVAEGYVFVAPKKGEARFGPMILDNRGSPVWFRPVRDDEDYRAADFKVQSYRGEPVLSWWEGWVTYGHGDGQYVILDGSYNELARVRAGNKLEGDLHEFLITERDTALITIYNTVKSDLSQFGGPRSGEVEEGVIQELDIATGEVLFEWHSLDHVGLDETYAHPEGDAPNPFDYFHINSIDVDSGGDLLVSARKTSAVYKIHRDSGEVIWRLDGKRSDFEMETDAKSVYQHDAIPQPDGTLTIFDNAISNDVEGVSRGVELELDEDAMTASLVREYPHPDGARSATQANMQTLPNSNVFIGWGSDPRFSEFSADGELLFDAALRSGADSYRAYRFPWTGHPNEAPAVAAEHGPDEAVTLYASYNGATEVAEWEVLGGEAPGNLSPVGTSPRKGFETAIAVRTGVPYLAARARDSSGRELGVSEVIEPERRRG